MGLVFFDPKCETRHDFQLKTQTFNFVISYFVIFIFIFFFSRSRFSRNTGYLPHSLSLMNFIINIFDDFINVLYDIMIFIRFSI